MARRNKDSKAGLIGGVVVAVFLGIVIAFLIYRPFDQPPPPPPKVDLNTPYDDTWGKLVAPDARGVVTHILVSWTGANPRVQVSSPRTKEEARKLIDSIWAIYRNTPTEAVWKELQEKHNEDSGDKHNKYPVGGNDGLDPAFSACGKSTKVGHARIVESAFGFHLIRRES